MRLTGSTKNPFFAKAGKSVPEIESADRLSFENVFAPCKGKTEAGLKEH